MIVKLNQTERAELLKAWRTGILDTSKIKALNVLQPAKRLTKEEAAELLKSLEKDY